jgi:hypothetical protein
MEPAEPKWGMVWPRAKALLQKADAEAAVAAVVATMLAEMKIAVAAAMVRVRVRVRVTTMVVRPMAAEGLPSESLRSSHELKVKAPPSLARPPEAQLGGQAALPAALTTARP